MKKYSGSGLVDYIIPIAVIAIVIGAGVFLLIKDHQMLHFLSASSDMELENDKTKGIINKNPPPPPMINAPKGSLGGTPENPVVQCHEGLCSIDFGDYILNGIPENFNDYVLASGASGGTDKISQILYSLAQQLADEGKADLANEIQKLAVYGHNIAALEREYENKINACNGNYDCIKALDTSPVSMPDGFNEMFASFPAGLTYADLQNITCIGKAQFIKNSDPSSFSNNLSGNHTAFVFVNQLDQVLGSSNIDDGLKGIIKELSWGIGAIGEDFQNNIQVLGGDRREQTFYDPITGQASSEPAVDSANALANYQNYNASKITHLDSSIICASGGNVDSGVDCN
jgi:hypothetical protein